MPGSINVEVSLYGAFRHMAPGDTITLTVPSGATLGQIRAVLREEIARRYPAFSQMKLLDSSALADETAIRRNQEVLSRDTKLAIIPPISGG